jgi:hypothetical protein
MELNYNNKRYLFSEYIEPADTGLYTAVLVDSNNVRCEIVWFNGELREINELGNE